jgi:hypothetical protein
MAVNISRAAVDWVSKGAGKLPAGSTMPRHVLADFLADAGNLAFLAEKASTSAVMQVETAVLKRLRLRNERDVVLERKTDAPRDGGMVYGTLPPTVQTGDTGGGRYPAKKSKR